MEKQVVRNFLDERSKAFVLHHKKVKSLAFLQEGAGTRAPLRPPPLLKNVTGSDLISEKTYGYSINFIYKLVRSM